MPRRVARSTYQHAGPLSITVNADTVVSTEMAAALVAAHLSLDTGKTGRLGKLPDRAQ